MLSIRTRLSALACAAVLAASGPTSAPAWAQAPALSPADRGLIVETLQRAGAPAAPDADDAALTGDLVQYARTELGQRVAPSSLDRFWGLSAPRRDVGGELARALAAGTLEAWLSGLAPPYPEYRALEAGAERYRGFVQAGGWRPLPPGKPPKPGRSDARAALLRARLAAEGYAVPEAADPVQFDAGLQQALMDFQTRHGLVADGALGAATLAALNVPAEERLAQIEANLERWRWLPHQLPADRFEVDIASQQAVLYEDGAPTLRMKAVVGKPSTHTPMFTSRVDAVVINPPWNVPSAIARAEILPKGPGYLARNDFRWVDGHLQQRAGPKSALGRIKFDLDSPFGVYLHDTPVKSAFARPVRLLSHGCMRLEKPQELAQALLAPQGWTPERIQAAIEAGATQRVDLKTTLPVYVVYRTAVADPSGAVDFRPDAYGWDAKLTAALGGTKTLRPGGPAGPTDCAEAPQPPAP